MYVYVCLFVCVSSLIPSVIGATAGDIRSFPPRIPLVYPLLPPLCPAPPLFLISPSPVFSFSLSCTHQRQGICLGSSVVFFPSARLVSGRAVKTLLNVIVSLLYQQDGCVWKSERERIYWQVMEALSRWLKVSSRSFKGINQLVDD